jgi:Mlc titration factor MtfA (ptsG expression regulator)
MAHAVSFDVFLGQTDHHDHALKKRFSVFQNNEIPIFRAMRQSRNDLLDDYGATNFDEFWAVCVVTFFEKSEEFSRTMPELYLSIAEVLNQDPLKPEKIINKELSGLAN